MNFKITCIHDRIRKLAETFYAETPILDNILLINLPVYELLQNVCVILTVHNYNNDVCHFFFFFKLHFYFY